MVNTTPQVGVLPLGGVYAAPMAGITDLPFRCICIEYGADFVYTEMVSAKGLYYKNKNTAAFLDLGEEAVAEKTGVQLFGSDADILAYAAKAAEEAGAALVDINMGCPAPKIVKNREGCALMADAKLVGQIVEKTAMAVKIPVTVKIRAGIERLGEAAGAVNIARAAAEAGAAAITVHGRTLEQGFSGLANWALIAKVKRAVSVPVIGNGDVGTRADALAKMREYGCDAVMIGRAARGAPWVFAASGVLPPNAAARLDIAAKHAQALCAYKGEYIGVREMRRHLCWYIAGLKGAAKTKTLIMSAVSLRELNEIIDSLRENV